MITVASLKQQTFHKSTDSRTAILNKFSKSATQFVAHFNIAGETVFLNPETRKVMFNNVHPYKQSNIGIGF